MSTKSAFNALLLAAVAMGLAAGQSLAAEGSINRQNGVVTIIGDNYDDDCYIYIDGNDIEIELTVRDAQGNVDDFDDKDYDLDDVSLIIFEGLNGDDDFWNSTSVPCRAYGDGGNDTLLGGWSDDYLSGGAGNDFVAGRSGDDDLFGGDGQDYLYGGSDNDYLKAGKGEDEWVIAGQSGEDTFATPATISFMMRQFVPVNRYVYYEDFDPAEDTEILFLAPLVLTPMFIAYPSF